MGRTPAETIITLIEAAKPWLEYALSELERRKVYISAYIRAPLKLRWTEKSSVRYSFVRVSTLSS